MTVQSQFPDGLLFTIFENDHLYATEKVIIEIESFKQLNASRFAATENCIFILPAITCPGTLIFEYPFFSDCDSGYPLVMVFTSTEQYRQFIKTVLEGLFIQEVGKKKYAQEQLRQTSQEYSASTFLRFFSLTFPVRISPGLPSNFTVAIFGFVFPLARTPSASPPSPGEPTLTDSSRITQAKTMADLPTNLPHSIKVKIFDHINIISDPIEKNFNELIKEIQELDSDNHKQDHQNTWKHAEDQREKLLEVHHPLFS